jgi:N-alpha-acetyl-L-2,4-diaminobutyrate deacetylase
LHHSRIGPFLNDLFHQIDHAPDIMIQAYTEVHASSVDVDLSDTHVLPPPSLLGTLDTHMTIDPSLTGKQHGHLVLPCTNCDGVPTHLRVPVCSIRGNEPGPTITLIAGIHGDEYEGSLALQQLTRDLAVDSVHGCLIVVPCVNEPGLRVGRRCLTLDGCDLDRCFPGDPQGSIGQRLAYELFERLIRPAELVLDLRSGGRMLNFALLAAVRFMGVSKRSSKGHGRQLHLTSEAAMIAFGAPNSVRFPASGPASCLQAAVAAAGKAYVQTELGGGGGCTAETLEVARTGCFNVLRFMGVLKEEVQLRATRMLEVRDSSFYVHAAVSGILEPRARLGHELWKGDRLASLVNFECTGSQAHDVAVPRNSVLLAMHHGGPVAAGDLVAILADEVQH